VVGAAVLRLREERYVERNERELPVTSYAVLGLLTYGERSGYDLAKLVEESIGFFFTPAKSQIYAELKRLVSLGYATEREVEQDRRPDKRVYAVTDEGMAALRGWLERPDVPPDEVRSPFMVKLFFGHHMDREALLSQLKEMRQHAQEELEHLQLIERTIKDEDGLFYPYLTLKCGLTYARAQIRWADQTIREVEGRDGG
jgi:DNA-binding PadR family transcriptional regulator